MNHEELNKVDNARRKDEHLKDQLGTLFDLESRREQLLNMIELKSSHHQHELTKHS